MAAHGLALVLLAVAFLPPLAFLLWLRAEERGEREPIPQVLRVFTAGAVLGVLVAFVLEVAFDLSFRRPYEASALAFPFAFLSAVVVAPVVEEVAKVLCVLAGRDPRHEPQDGLVYGAAAGLGFAATENLVYGGVALATQGVEAYAATMAVRSVAATLLHASASAFAGYGLLEWLRGGRSVGFFLVMLALAMGMHAAYNAVAGTRTVLALALATTASVLAFVQVRRAVRGLDGHGRPNG